MRESDRHDPPPEMPSLRQMAHGMFSDWSDPAMGPDFGIVKVMAAALWAIGGTIAALLLLVAPPTQAIGRPGWIVALALVVLAFALALRRARMAGQPTIGELLVGCCVAVAGIAVLEWLAGGREVPYHHLYMLPAVFAAAVEPRRGVLVFLALLTVALCAPIVYEGITPRDAVDTGTQLVLLVALGVATRMLITLIRAQRATLRSDRQRAHELARRDGLTGLGNRLALEERLEAEIARVGRSGGRLSVVVADVDGFKRINDELGHAGGDDCLRQVADSLRAAARTADECYRWGGDEFVVLLPDTAGPEARLAGERFSSAVDGLCTARDGQSIRMTCGSAELVEGQDGAALLEAADRELIALKRAAGDPEAHRGLTLEAGSGGG